MACCYPEDCGGYAVTPLLMAPCYPTKYCEDPPMCYPCLPRCPKGQNVYCYEKKQPKTPPRTPACHDDREDWCDSPRFHDRDCSSPRQRRPRSPPPTRQSSCTPSPNYCPTCCQPTCKPVKTKYVIPCYRYEDGRIERYVPTRHGRLPMSSYRRNGMQDQIHGYRGAMRYLCAGEGPLGCYVHTTVEPLRQIYTKITQEMLPVKKKKDRK